MPSNATSPKPLILGVKEVAALYGRTEKAIRHAVDRNADWLPEPMRLGRRICWLARDVELFVERLATRESRPTRVGRPPRRAYL